MSPTSKGNSGGWDQLRPSETEAANDDPLSDFFVSVDERNRNLGAYGGSTSDAAWAAAELERLLAFWVGDEEYAVDIGEIQEIIKVPLVTEVPRVDASVVGITSLRGTIVPILDLRRVLQLAQPEHTGDTRVLVVRGDGEPVGLLVDRVSSVVRFNQSDLEPTPATMQGATSDMIRGVGRIDERLLIVLAVPTVLNVMERHV